MEKDIILLLAGVVVGVMNAIAGGGLLVGLPIMIALGVPALNANATGALATELGQVSSALGYWRYLRRVPLRYALFLLPIVLGGAGGALMLRHTSAHDFARMMPALVLLGVLLFAFQPLLHFHLHRHLKGRTKTWPPMALIGLLMIPCSFYGGYFGAGYGFLMLGLLGFVSLPDAHMMNAMKNVAAIFMNAVTIACLFSSHLIDWHVGLVMAAGNVVGGYAGARGAQKVSSHWLRIVITVIGMTAVIYLAFKQY